MSKDLFISQKQNYRPHDKNPQDVYVFQLGIYHQYLFKFPNRH